MLSSGRFFTTCLVTTVSILLRFALNKKSSELEYKMYLQIRSLTRDEYLAEQRSGPEAAREGLFPVNVIDDTLQHSVMRYLDKIETS